MKHSSRSSPEAGVRSPEPSVGSFGPSIFLFAGPDLRGPLPPSEVRLSLRSITAPPGSQTRGRERVAGKRSDWMRP